MPQKAVVSGSYFWPGPGEDDTRKFFSKGSIAKVDVRVDTWWEPDPTDVAKAKFFTNLRFINAEYKDPLIWTDDDNETDPSTTYKLNWELKWFNPATQKWEYAGPEGVGFYLDRDDKSFPRQGGKKVNYAKITGLGGTILPGSFSWSIGGNLTSGYWQNSMRTVPPDSSGMVRIDAEGTFEITTQDG